MIDSLPPAAYDGPKRGRLGQRMCTDRRGLCTDNLLETRRKGHGHTGH